MFLDDFLAFLANESDSRGFESIAYFLPYDVSCVTVSFAVLAKTNKIILSHKNDRKLLCMATNNRVIWKINKIIIIGKLSSL